MSLREVLAGTYDTCGLAGVVADHARDVQPTLGVEGNPLACVPGGRALAIGGSDCGDKSCWKPKGTKGYSYKDSNAQFGGLVKIGFGGGDDRRIGLGWRF